MSVEEDVVGALSRAWDAEPDTIWEPPDMPRFKVGDRVRIRLSGECGYCFEEEAELDGAVGTIDEIGHLHDSGQDQRFTNHPYWVTFDKRIPGQPWTSHYAASELIPLDGSR